MAAFDATVVQEPDELALIPVQQPESRGDVCNYGHGWGKARGKER